MPTSKAGRLILVAGQSRSGKTYWTEQQTNRDGNLLVWDSMGEFAARKNNTAINDPRALAMIAARGARGRFACSWPVDQKHFDLWCKLAWLWIRESAKRGQRITLIVEELADITSPGKAPPGWGQIVRKSLRYGPHIYALTQRPAESDKTVIGNASALHCHAMARARDRAYMAEEMDIDRSALDALKMPHFQWIERDNQTRLLSTGGKGKRPPIPK